MVDYTIVSNSSPLPLSTSFAMFPCSPSYPSDVGLGHLISFGQWKVVGSDSEAMPGCNLSSIAASIQLGAFLPRT